MNKTQRRVKIIQGGKVNETIRIKFHNRGYYQIMEDRGLPVPPFAYWGVPEWKAAGKENEEIIENSSDGISQISEVA